MIEYIVSQIIQNKIKYKEVISIYPQYREKINDLLKKKNFEHLIEE